MTKFSDIGPMHFPPSWYGGPPDPPEDWDNERETMLISHDEATLVCLTKAAIKAMSDLVIFTNEHSDLLPLHVNARIIEADYLLNSAEDRYINDERE